MEKLRTVLFLMILAVGLSFSLPAEPAAAQDALTGSADAPLCLPEGGDGLGKCEMLGPTAYLSEMRALGLALPRQPLPGAALDPAFGELPYNYVRLHEDETPIFPTLESAMANEGEYRIIPPGFAFATYVDYYQGSGNGRHYMIEPGMWIRGGHTSGGVAPSAFTGLQFAAAPERQFGWIIYATASQTEPGPGGALTGNNLARFTVIQVYQSVEINGTSWLLIGPDEWVEKTQTALVYPADAPPDGVTNGRWIEVNLFEQTISVYQENRLVFATLTSTGIPGWWTRPGLFQISEKLETTPMEGSFEADRSDYYYLEDVPWTMYFDEARALHGAYWHNYFGYEQSHGCVNLSPADSHWLYLWANVGDYVYVWDPSGKTPTDPSLYTAGGA
jgi:hypothetical protein